MLENTDFKDDFVVKDILKKIHDKYSLEQLEEIKKEFFTYNFENNLLEEKFKKLYKEI